MTTKLKQNAFLTARKLCPTILPYRIGVLAQISALRGDKARRIADPKTTKGPASDHTGLNFGALAARRAPKIRQASNVALL